MYTSPEDENKIPSSLLINFENTNYRIFLSNDELTRFYAKKLDTHQTIVPKQINSNPV